MAPLALLQLAGGEQSINRGELELPNTGGEESDNDIGSIVFPKFIINKNS
jgi:hypothetical protein